jgi:hypothetical protein
MQKQFDSRIYETFLHAAILTRHPTMYINPTTFEPDWGIINSSDSSKKAFYEVENKLI